MLPNISRIKSNKTVKFDLLIEHNTEKFFFKNHAENEAGRLIPDLFLFFKNVFFEVKASGLQLRDILNFDFLVKGLRIVSPPHFVYDFFKKMLLMLYSIS